LLSVRYSFLKVDILIPFLNILFSILYFEIYLLLFKISANSLFISLFVKFHHIVSGISSPSGVFFEGVAEKENPRRG
jgi:hypothetical protein